MSSGRHAFIIMPFHNKKGPDGTDIDFDVVYQELLGPAIEMAGLRPHRADADRRGGSIHADMFQELLLAEFVVADLTLDNANVWYEIGVRHALRAGGSVLTYALRDRLPFDIAGQRMVNYKLVGGALDPIELPKKRQEIADAIGATLGDWRGRRASPVYQQLANLKEPDWKSLKAGSVNEFWDALQNWRTHVEIARRKQCPGDILVLADETPNRVLEFEALRTAACALIRLNHPKYALNVIEKALKLDPDDVESRQIEGVALGRREHYEEARETLGRLAEDQRKSSLASAEQDRAGDTPGLLARTWKDEWSWLWNRHPERQADPLKAARETSGTLQNAARAYADAFRAAPADYYPGINALTLGRLWEHINARESNLDLEMIASGLRWAINCALARSRDYWSLVSRAELAIIEDESDKAVADYTEAAALALANRDRFALDFSS